MRSGHENCAPYFSSMLEDDRLLEQAFTLSWHFCLRGGMAEGPDPEFCPGVGDERSRDASTHAVANDHHRFAQRKFLFDGVELVPEDSRRVWIGITARIAKEPKLVIPPDIFVAAQIVQHRYPSGRCIHETM